ncbi:unnamed protein product [Mytilus coruscus]|uniref:C-type lectin domain-containing protein n=1 Tax=Mytilus coruscus TaxID=42192 RepID=A0A6J7ZVG9_MYTCO|nr:unnamed protein product [Mytilus coruscus]
MRENRKWSNNCSSPKYENWLQPPILVSDNLCTYVTVLSSGFEWNLAPCDSVTKIFLCEDENVEVNIQSLYVLTYQSCGKSVVSKCSCPVVQNTTLDHTNNSMIPSAAQGIDSTQFLTIQLMSTERYSNDTICTCVCINSSIVAVSDKDFQKMIQNLRIDPRKTSAFVRRRTSAPDYRVSAASIGITGVIVLVIVFGYFACHDIVQLCKTFY